MRLKVIVNPESGRGRGKRKFARSLEALRHSGASIDVEESRSAEHLTELGRLASSAGYDRVVVCGGDGTVHHAVREFDLARGTLAVIPLGSGDDFATILGIPSHPARAAAIALSGVVREIDVALANSVRYLLVASIGFDAMVARAASTVTKLRGPAIYLYATLRALRRFKPIRIGITEQGVRRATDVMFAVVANAPRYGGGIQIAPAALMDDRQLDLYVIGVTSRFDLLLTLPLAYRGKHTRRPYVRTSRGTSFGFDSAEPLEIFADGEFITTTPVTLSLAPDRLRVVVPSV